jgi:hypothetical protein
MYPHDDIDRDGDKLDGDDAEIIDHDVDGGENLDDRDDVPSPHVECRAPRWCWEYRECQSGECGVDFSRVVGPVDDDFDDDPIY